MTTPDGAVTGTSYSQNAATFTDAAGHQRQTTTDALGRMTKVVEDPASSNFATTYTYDSMSNLTGVTQRAQTRSFGYDSQQNLISATNPESGTVTYSYYPNGSLKTKKDARGITATSY